MPLKGWEKQKYSKPVRRVIARRELALVDESGERYGTETVLTLDCKHEYYCGYVLDTEQTPKRRRCRECASAAHASRVEFQRLKGTRD
jgi:predicted Zn-ribbon and HTH transcriptional regulator